ncbi:MAG TPA: ABC transporter permease [Gemmatimonadales bacterium]|nr:ABC transporter permease [Gemmatimonadales bacterium]
MKLAALMARAAGGAAIGAVGAFLLLPVLALLLQVRPRTLLAELADPTVLDALRLSLLTSAGATVVVVLLGLPVGLLLGTREFPGKRLLEALVALPMVLPPTVAGLALLLAFGRTGLLGGALSLLGITVPFSTLAVVIAQVFVALPFFIGASAAGFRGVNRAYTEVAATLRASRPYTAARILVPLSVPSLAAGAAMGWARALGEFGATITFAGNVPGVTQTMPLAVYLRLETDFDAAIALALMLLAVSFGVLFALGASPFSLGRTGAAGASR